MYNVFGFGDFEPNNTGLQMNVSSGFNSLAELIGEHQGTFHTDQHDHPPWYTLLTLCFKWLGVVIITNIHRTHPLLNIIITGCIKSFFKVKKCNKSSSFLEIINISNTLSRHKFAIFIALYIYINM